MGGHYFPKNSQIIAKMIMNINNIARRWQLFGEILFQFAKIGRK
jgi:hypothetical protein